MLIKFQPRGCANATAARKEPTAICLQAIYLTDQYSVTIFLAIKLSDKWSRLSDNECCAICYNQGLKLRVARRGAFSGLGWAGLGRAGLSWAGLPAFGRCLFPDERNRLFPHQEIPACSSAF